MHEGRPVTNRLDAQTMTRGSAFSAHSDSAIPAICEPTSTGSSRKSANNMNVHTTCGRHTDQFLFSGPSLGEMARSLFERSRSRRREEKEEN